MRNILTIDVEDWFQVENHARLIARDEWPRLELRVEANVEKILRILEGRNARATFFMLGWLADRLPDLVLRIAEAGHEIASHGWSHRPIWSLEPADFADEARRSRELLQQISGQAVLGYRAPTFSVTKRTLWALRILEAEGYLYDSSIFPVHHDRYGIPESPLPVHRRDEGIWEIPLSVYQFGPLRLPVAGGGYLRLYPRALTGQAVRKINRAGRPAVVYLHPWELDPEQPQVRGLSAFRRWRHHVGIGRNEKKLDWLVRTFSFTTAVDALIDLGVDITSSLEVEQVNCEPAPDLAGRVGRS